MAALSLWAAVQLGREVALGVARFGGIWPRARRRGARLLMAISRQGGQERPVGPGWVDRAVHRWEGHLKSLQVRPTTQQPTCWARSVSA